MTDDTIGAIAMDLKRAALGSEKTLQIFLDEAVKKNKKVNKNLPAYIQQILKDFGKDRENLLMYSTLLQNYATRR